MWLGTFWRAFHGPVVSQKHMDWIRQWMKIEEALGVGTFSFSLLNPIDHFTLYRFSDKLSFFCFLSSQIMFSKQLKSSYLMNNLIHPIYLFDANKDQIGTI